jgi:ATP synthase subunit 6
MLIYNPLNQFEIVPIFLFQFWHNNIIINNFSFYSIFLIFLICFLFLLNKKQKLLFFSNIFYFFFIKIYFFLQSILKQNIFTHPFFIQSFFPLSFSLFCMILFTNIFGLIPFSFTSTSYIIETFLLSCSFFIGLTLLAIFFQGLNSFIQTFIPQDIPVALKPLLIVIEVISYVSRAFSLAIRLFANMMAGHTLLHILSDFSLKLGKIKYLYLIFPLIIVLLISILEVGVSFLQAYVFILLIALYYNDSLKINQNLLYQKKILISLNFYEILNKNLILKLKKL